MTDLVAVEPGETAGAIVYWALSGAIDLVDLEEALDNAPIEKLPAPEPPSLEQVLYRAAQDAVTSKRQLVRPGGARGTYAFVEETATGTVVTYKQLASMRVIKEKSQEPRLEVFPTEPEAQGTADLILARCSGVYRTLMTASDVSSWLLACMRFVHGVGLRDRGGIYFVPRDRLGTWRTLVDAVRSVSDHSIFEIPAMKTEEAVAAILSAVRNDAVEAMQEMETYVAGVTSTKGLNAVDRKLEDVLVRVRHYATLLGVELADLESRAVTLNGAAQAARLMQQAAE